MVRGIAMGGMGATVMELRVPEATTLSFPDMDGGKSIPKEGSLPMSLTFFMGCGMFSYR